MFVYFLRIKFSISKRQSLSQRMGLSITDALVKAFEQLGQKQVHYRDLVKVLLNMEDLESLRGPTPANTVNAALRRNIKTQGLNSLFVNYSHSPGMYGLRQNIQTNVETTNREGNKIVYLTMIIINVVSFFFLF